MVSVVAHARLSLNICDGRCVFWVDGVDDRWVPVDVWCNTRIVLRVCVCAAAFRRAAGRVNATCLRDARGRAVWVGAIEEILL